MSFGRRCWLPGFNATCKVSSIIITIIRRVVGFFIIFFFFGNETSTFFVFISSVANIALSIESRGHRDPPSVAPLSLNYTVISITTRSGTY